MQIKGLVLAAGMSSRMDGFKPLMELNGYPMIRMTLDSIRNMGVSDIAVVTGNHAGEVEEAIAAPGIITVRNELYDRTDMLESVKLGLSRISDADAVLLLPGDMPGILPRTLCRLREALEVSGAQVIFPSFNGERGHPPIFRKACFDAILGYGGENGLRGVLESFDYEIVPVEDPGVLLDADTPADFAALSGHIRKIRGLSSEKCEELYGGVNLLEHIRAHCRAVADLAAHMAERLSQNGICIDIELCRSAGMLHDIRRLEQNHPRAAGNFFHDMGLEALARVVSDHNGFAERNDFEPLWDESAVVCLADKLVKEDKRVDLDERYAWAIRTFPPENDRGRFVRQDLVICAKLLREYEELTHEKLQ